MAAETNISQAFGKAARWQLIATVVAALIALVLAGRHGAVSALGGGAAVMLGSYAGAMLARHPGGTPGAVLLTLLKAEAVKIMVIALLLLAIFKLYAGLIPLALIGGLACAALISGAALRALDIENNG